MRHWRRWRWVVVLGVWGSEAQAIRLCSLRTPPRCWCTVGCSAAAADFASHLLLLLLVLPLLLPAERDALLREGFSGWMRRDFNAFVRACEKYGRAALADIARDVENKSEEEVGGCGWGGVRAGVWVLCCACSSAVVVVRACLGAQGCTAGGQGRAASQPVPLDPPAACLPACRCAPTPRCSGSGTPRSTTTRRCAAHAVHAVQFADWSSVHASQPAHRPCSCTHTSIRPSRLLLRRGRPAC